MFLGGVLIGMFTKFQVDTIENDAFIAFQISKMATFHDSFSYALSSNQVFRFYTLIYTLHYALSSNQVFRFYTLFYVPNVVLR